MKVDLLAITPPGVGGIQSKTRTAKAQQGPSFADYLREAFNEVNDLQLKADRITRQFFAGEVEDLHQVMIATEQANLALQLTVQIRNKIIEAYQEISRMQV